MTLAHAKKYNYGFETENFSKSELEVLTVEVERHIEVLFSKLNNSVTKSAKDHSGK